MAFSINTICCCNLLVSSPNPTSTSASTNPSSSLFQSHQYRRPLKKVNQISWQRKEEEEKGSWRSRCVLGVACLIINTGFYSSDHDHQMGLINPNMSVAAFAAADSSTTHHAAAAAKVEVVVVNGTAGNIKKWSDKRVCPAWRLNSLETIVPENLPRPSAHRRSESVSTTLSSSSSSSHETSTAPPLVNSSTVVILKSNVNNCFSM